MFSILYTCILEIYSYHIQKKWISNIHVHIYAYVENIFTETSNIYSKKISIQTTMSSYFSALQKNRWTRVCNTKPYFTIKLGSRGLNGVCITLLTKKVQSDLVNWFESKSIRLVENVPDHGLWWSFERFSNQYETGNKDDTMHEGGYTFKMGIEAYKRMFPNRK